MNNLKLQHYFLAIVLLGVLVLTFLVFRPFLGVLAMAAVFAVIFQPIYRWMLSRLGGGGNRRGWASLFTVIAATILVLIPLTLLGAQIVREAGQLYDSLADGTGQSYMEAALLGIERLMGQYFPQTQGLAAEVSANIGSYLRQGALWLVQNLGAAFSGIATLLVGFIIFFIALFYFLRDGKEFKAAIVKLSPLPDGDDESIFARLELAVNSVVRGNLTIAIIQGVLTAIGFTIFGVPNAVLWGTVAAIAALIPGFGTGLVILPAIIYLFVSSNDLSWVGLLLWGIVAVGLIDNFLGPRLIGRGAKLHPLFILLAVVGGIAFFGPIGVFLGPLTLSLLFALLLIYSDAAGGNGSAAA
jgi:predicted PurR-regulated permease PerM